MRKKLEPYLDTYVLCKGWIGDWKDINEKRPQRRVFVSKPIIKQPNKDVLFKDLPIISTEDHLNLFIDKEDLDVYEKNSNGFELNSSLSFTGIIQRYMRSDGSMDYGIYPTSQSLLHYKLEEINVLYHYLAEVEGVLNERFFTFAKAAKEDLIFLSDDLERSGDQLPTFLHTYDWYRREINSWLATSEVCMTRIKTACSNRAYRRKNKISKEFCSFVKAFKS